MSSNPRKGKVRCPQCERAGWCGCGMCKGKGWVSKERLAAYELLLPDDDGPFMWAEYDRIIEKLDKAGIAP